jgi:hypothetical protein
MDQATDYIIIIAAAQIEMAAFLFFLFFQNGKVASHCQSWFIMAVIRQSAAEYETRLTCDPIDSNAFQRLESLRGWRAAAGGYDVWE